MKVGKNKGIFYITYFTLTYTYNLTWTLYKCSLN